MSFADNIGGEKQPYKYNGKEEDTRHGLNLYDYLARQYDGTVPRFTSIDPHAENYYSWSPYTYVGNNPLKYIDPTGMDTVPSNEVWEYHLVDYRSNGKGTHRTDRYIPVMVDGKEKYRLHYIETGENEGNYLAEQRYGENEEGYEEYSYDYVVGADKVGDFKSGETKGNGYMRGFVKLAYDSGVDPSKSHFENMVSGWWRVVSDPTSWMGGNAYSTLKPFAKTPLPRGTNTWNHFRSTNRGRYTSKSLGVRPERAQQIKSTEYQIWKQGVEVIK